MKKMMTKELLLVLKWLFDNNLDSLDGIATLGSTMLYSGVR
jgi:hypothetical protein